jgi:hypothetical protein
VIVWRDQAEHASQSLSKGSRVVVIGRLQQWSWTAEDGSARSTVEVAVEELGPSLRWAVGCSTGLRSAKLRRRPGGSWARPASTARVRERRGQMAGRGRADKELVERLKSVPLFASCSARELASVARFLKEVEFPASRPIVKEGHTGTGMHVIMEAETRVMVSDRTRRRLGQGAFFG